jgi:uncharacterized YigZ family protein
MKDHFLTLAATSQSIYKVKGSRFIGMASPVSGQDDVEAFIVKMRKQYYDATHHCYAYRIGLEPKLIYRYYDDGEPSGTAGKPIFDVITGLKITDCVCMVIRYFGGIKLGTGGLGRAYSHCARETLQNADIIKKYRKAFYQIIFSYEHIGSVMSVLSRFPCIMLNTEYGKKAAISLEIRRKEWIPLKKELMNHTKGQIEFLTEMEE